MTTIAPLTLDAAWASKNCLQTYIVTRDRALPPRLERRQIANLARCAVVTFDSGHEPFAGRPKARANVLNGIAGPGIPSG